MRPPLSCNSSFCLQYCAMNRQGLNIGTVRDRLNCVISNRIISYELAPYSNGNDHALPGNGHGLMNKIKMKGMCGKA